MSCDGFDCSLHGSNLTNQQALLFSPYLFITTVGLVCSFFFGMNYFLNV